MVTRRDFGLLALSGAGVIAAQQRASAAPLDLSFPAGFKWGCATAAYQIEGAVNDDGRGESIWDVFSHAEGKIAGGANGDIACDSYRRYREDTQLLRALGANAYRLSVAWPRIFPEGRGQPNQRGVDHYKRVVDDLLENCVEPYITLFHWDLPAALEGGWQSRDTARAFADYAGFITAQLSDRVSHFMTVNELSTFVGLGYSVGIHAPGLRLPARNVNQIRHHALLAHGLGVQAIRAHARTGTRIGLAENAGAAIPVIETPENIEAAKKAMRAMNYAYLTAVLEGRYSDEYLAQEGVNAPQVAEGDMTAIGSALDFVGINCYGPGAYVRADPNAPNGFVVLPPPSSFPVMVLPWLMVGPEACYWAVRLTSEIWGPKAIYISENGCVSNDVLVGGRVEDSDRVMYLRNYITQLHRAVAEGYPVKGYFLWTLLDNFEWAEGFSKRFGIYYTDFATQQRLPKLSAAWYRELIRRNAVV